MSFSLTVWRYLVDVDVAILSRMAQQPWDWVVGGSFLVYVSCIDRWVGENIHKSRVS